MPNNLVPIKQKADEWGITVRRVQMLCKASQIDGAVKLNGQWFIPENSEKPTEGRWPSYEEKSQPGKVNIDLSYISMLSHDIRNALNSILGYTDLITDNSNSSELVKEYAENIANAGQNLLGLTNNIIELANLKSNKIIVDENNCKIRNIVESACNQEIQFAQKKNINIVTNFNINNESIVADADKLIRAIGNLLNNAIKFSKNNEIVQIRVEELESIEEGYIRYNYSIVDNGIGMTEAEIKHVFDNFAKLNSENEGIINSGSGLGMSITKGLVEAMGGEINVISQKGLGTKAIITMNHKVSEEAVIGTDISNMKLFAGKRILLAEDDELNRDIEKTVLENAGFVVETAQDGIVCVAMLETNPEGYYDAILMDLTMPNLGGNEASRFIRELPNKSKADIPIIAMTASVLTGDKESARYSGMDAFIEKPINISRVYDAFKECLF